MRNDTILPNGWVTTKVGDICREIQYGYTASASDEPCGPRFLRITDIQNGQVVWPSVPHCSINPSDTEKFSLRPGDIVFARTGGTVGKSFLINHVPEPSVFASYLIRLTANEVIDPQYLYHFFQSLSYWEQIGLKKGGLQGNVNATTLSSIELAVCPTNEQHRIVAKIEELFSELDKGVESLTTAREQLDFYRLVILHQALIDRDGVTFPTSPLSELIGEIGQGWSPKCDVNTPANDGEWAIIKTTAVQPMAYLGHECKPLPNSLQPRPSIRINDGDLLMTRKGPRPRTGVVCHVKKARPNSMLCDTVYRFRAREEVVLPEYLEIALNAPTVVQELNARKSGISESGISLNHGKLQSLPIPIPSSLADQAHIVRTVRERMSLVEHQCALVAEQIQRADVLRQAILKRAFSGQLLAQDTADEPASVLLERIRAQREESGTPKRRNNKNGKKEAA